MSCVAHNNILNRVHKDVPFVSKGYIINIYGENGIWIFQPCKDSSKFILDALNGNSFFVQDMRNDLFLNWLADSRGVSNKIPIEFYDSYFHKKIKDTLSYIYCRVKINPIERSRKLDSCNYIINYKGSDHGLACWDLTSVVMDLEPLNVGQRSRFIDILNEKGRAKPVWIMDGDF